MERTRRIDEHPLNTIFTTLETAILIGTTDKISTHIYTNTTLSQASPDSWSG